MERLKLVREKEMTLEDGCNKYLENCKERNLRAGTINHYSISYRQFYKYFGKDMPLKNFNESVYKKYVLHLRENLNNDVSINSYLRDLITTLHYLMNEELVPYFKMRAIKVDKSHIETYSDEELITLLKKPNIKNINADKLPRIALSTSFKKTFNLTPPTY